MRHRLASSIRRFLAGRSGGSGGRISSAMSVLLITSVLISVIILDQYVSATVTFPRLVSEVDQRFHLPILKRLALKQLPPSVLSGTDDGIRNSLLLIQQECPRFEPYLIRSDGKVIAPEENSVNLQVSVPEVASWAREGVHSFPLFAPDPRSPVHFVPVLVTAIPAQPSTYLYVVLSPGSHLGFDREGGRYRAVWEFNANAVVLCISCILMLLLVPPTLRRMLQTLRHWSVKIPLPEESKELGDDFSDLLGATQQMTSLMSSRVMDLTNKTEERKVIVSHTWKKLQGPLSEIHSDVRKLLSRNGSYNSRSILARVATHAQHVTELVDHVFDVVRYEFLEEQLHKQNFLAFECIQEIGLEYRAKGEGRGITVLFEVSPRGPVGWGDIELVYDAFSRLVDTAVSSLSTGTTLSLSASEDSEYTRLTAEQVLKGESSARDDGRYTEANLRRRNAPANLVIAERIARAHGGMLATETRIRRGLWFELILPRPSRVERKGEKE